jgi:hypothetical protein
MALVVLAVVQAALAELELVALLLLVKVMQAATSRLEREAETKAVLAVAVQVQ